MASKRLGPLPRRTGSALAHGCGRGGRVVRPLPRAAAVWTGLRVQREAGQGVRSPLEREGARPEVHVHRDRRGHDRRGEGFHPDHRRRRVLVQSRDHKEGEQHWQRPLRGAHVWCRDRVRVVGVQGEASVRRLGVAGGGQSVVGPQPAPAVCGERAPSA